MVYASDQNGMPIGMTPAQLQAISAGALDSNAGSDAFGKDADIPGYNDYIDDGGYTFTTANNGQFIMQRTNETYLEILSGQTGEGVSNFNAENVARLLGDNLKFQRDVIDTVMAYETRGRMNSDAELQARINKVDLSYDDQTNTLTFESGRKNEDGNFEASKTIALKDTVLSTKDSTDGEYHALQIGNDGKLNLTVWDTDGNVIKGSVNLGAATYDTNENSPSSETIEEAIESLKQGWNVESNVVSQDGKITKEYANVQPNKKVTFDTVEGEQNLSVKLEEGTDGNHKVEFDFSETPTFTTVEATKSVTVGDGEKQIKIDGMTGTITVGGNGGIEIKSTTNDDGSRTNEITGLTNKEWDVDNIAQYAESGKAATEAQLKQVQDNLADSISNVNQSVTKIKNNYVSNIKDSDNGVTGHKWQVTQNITMENGETKKETLTIDDYNTVNTKMSNEWDGDNVTVKVFDDRYDEGSINETGLVKTTIEDVARASKLGDIYKIDVDIYEKNGDETYTDVTMVDVVNNINKKIDQGWNAQIDGLTVNNVKMGEVQNFITGKNIVLTNANGGIEIATVDDPDFTEVTIGKDGEKITINNSGIDMNHKEIKNITKIVLNGNSNNTEVIYNSNTNRIEYGEKEISTTDDGYKYQGDIVNPEKSGEDIFAKVNKTINFSGGVTEEGNLTDGNIGVITTQSAYGENVDIEIKLSKDLQGLNSVESNTITVKETLKVAETVEITKDGINMNNTKIENVAPGELSPDSQDAVNGSQLFNTNQKLDRLGNRVDKVGAGAAALAALHPLDFDPDDKLSFSAGVGNYGSETATALGAFYRPSEKVMLSAAGTMGNGENMVNLGVTFALDKTNNVSNSRVAMAREIQDLKSHIVKQDAQIAELIALVGQLTGKSIGQSEDSIMFPDVPENHWAYDYIEGLQKRGIVEGYPDGNFGGDRSMTRYEYAAMLYRALEKGFPVDSRLLDEFDAELGRIRIDRIKGLDDDDNKIERVRVNQYEDRDDYGSKLTAVNEAE